MKPAPARPPLDLARLRSLVINSQRMGAFTRFIVHSINHSCDLNCGQSTASLNHADDRIHELAFFALEDIPAGTELRCNYTDNEDNEPVTYEEVQRRAIEAGIDPMRCLCRAEICKR
ncbi:MAG: SET domain-containing [Lasallia pustulata]|uniref:SET domain-containing n=1 Tax=Lasallia pustulata TaxID=136370 RepID=A0A5M8PHG5_9LECA|nr:MAG: SET domain-containing [Lasallia pustulata]